jgi:hypothetical protein
MPQPLPENPYDSNTDAPLHDAYSQCVMMETVSDNNQESVMLARCLGYLMLELPGSEARGFVANEVVACEANFDKMATLSQLYIDHLIRLCEFCQCFAFNQQHAIDNSSLIRF